MRDPFKKIGGHNRKRGTKWYTDVIDWLGGYPYDSATPAEIKEFVEGLGCRLEQTAKTKNKPGLLGTGDLAPMAAGFVTNPLRQNGSI